MSDPIVMIQYASDLLDVISNFIPKLIAFASISAAFFPPVAGSSWLSRFIVLLTWQPLILRKLKIRRWTCDRWLKYKASESGAAIR